MARAARTHLPIGEQLRRMRLHRGLTLMTLVERCGGTGEVSEAAISRIETSYRHPNLATMELLSTGLECRFVIEGGATWIDDLPDKPAENLSD